MGRLVVVFLLIGAGALALSAPFRREVGERARDVSDRLMMLLLRATSGFASDVSDDVVAEERERRLRWRSGDAAATARLAEQAEATGRTGRPADRAEIEPPAADARAADQAETLELPETAKRRPARARGARSRTGGQPNGGRPSNTGEAVPEPPTAT